MTACPPEARTACGEQAVSLNRGRADPPPRLGRAPRASRRSAGADRAADRREDAWPGRRPSGPRAAPGYHQQSLATPEGVTLAQSVASTAQPPASGLGRGQTAAELQTDPGLAAQHPLFSPARRECAAFVWSVGNEAFTPRGGVLGHRRRPDGGAPPCHHAGVPYL